MSLLDKARELDRARNTAAAAQAYEEGLRHGEGDRMTYVDLAVHYFTLLDPGELAVLKPTQDFLDFAWRRANDLLKSAKQRFGNESEIAGFGPPWQATESRVVLFLLRIRTIAQTGFCDSRET